MQPRVRKIVGVAFLLSAAILLVMGEFLREPGRELVVVALRLCAIVDALLGLVFFLLSLRKAGERGRGKDTGRDF